MVRHKRIQHRRHRHNRKQRSGYATDAVAKVQKTDGEAAEDDGEVEPGEEGALVGEEDFGLDAGGEGDAFACGRAWGSVGAAIK